MNGSINLFPGRCVHCGERVMARRGTLVMISGEARRKPAHTTCATSAARAPLPPPGPGEERFFLYDSAGEPLAPFDGFPTFTSAFDAASSRVSDRIVIGRWEAGDDATDPVLHVERSGGGMIVFYAPDGARKVG